MEGETNFAVLGDNPENVWNSYRKMGVGWGEHKGPESSSCSAWLLAESAECVWVVGEIFEVLLIESGRGFHSSACLPDANDRWMPRAYRRF